jgi:hypothetical protein
LADEVHRQHRSVAADRQVRQQQEVLGVPEVLDQADRSQIQLAGEQRVVQSVRRVLAQIEIQQRAGAHEAPVERQAVEELDVPDPRPGCPDRVRFRGGHPCRVGAMLPSRTG